MSSSWFIDPRARPEKLLHCKTKALQALTLVNSLDGYWYGS